MRRIRFLVSLALLAWSTPNATAQLPVPSLRLATGFGVDTTAARNRDVFQLWRRYLTEPSDSARATLWSSSERAMWQPYDLLASYVYQGFSDFTVIRLAPVAGLRDAYAIVTLVSTVEDSTRAVRPLALYRVYASREEGQWLLANALPRMTRHWSSDTVGAITFVHPSSHTLDRRRAQASASFADSLARAFGLSPPKPITFYFTDDLGETLRALGLEFFPLGSDSIGGRSNVSVRHVYVGSPDAEGYRHELAHIVLAGEVSRQTAPLLAEGLMTWTAGSAGLDYRQLLPGLAQYLASHPKLTLEQIMTDPPPRLGTLDVGYNGLAVLCDLVFRAKGLKGLRAILRAGRGPSQVLDAAAQQLGTSRDGLETRWRSAISRR